MKRQGQGGSGQEKIEQALEDLLENSYGDPGHALAVFSVCLILIRRLSNSRPLALRRARAMEIYRLADTLAEDNRSWVAPDEPRE